MKKGNEIVKKQWHAPEIFCLNIEQTESNRNGLFPDGGHMDVETADGEVQTVDALS